MSRSHVLALSALAMLASCMPPASAYAQHALPIEALTFDGMTVRSVRAPDTEELPVRVVIGNDQGPRFRVDVFSLASNDAARALLAARIGTLSTMGLVSRTGFGRAQAFATAASGPTGLVAMSVENVVIIVRAIASEDAAPLALHLAQAVVASAPPAMTRPSDPGHAEGDVVTIQEPAGAVDWLVTCDGACEARRIDHAFRVGRTGDGAMEIAVHIVDAFLRAQHLRTSY